VFTFQDGDLHIHRGKDRRESTLDLNNNGPLFISAHLQWEHKFSKDTPIPKINPSYAEHKKEIQITDNHYISRVFPYQTPCPKSRMVRDTQAEVRQRGCLGGALSPDGKLEGAVNSTPGSVLIPTLLWGFFPSVKPLLLLFLMSKPFVQDDESLKYLTHEEKDVLLFFEETIDSLEDDFEEQVLCDGGAQGHSPRSLEESASGPSEPEDVVDLVQLGPGAGEPESPRDVTEAAERPEGGVGGYHKLPSLHFAFVKSPVRRSVSPEQSQPGPAREAVPARAGAHGGQQSRGVQTEQPLPMANGFQSLHDILKSHPGPFVSTGKTVTFRPDPALPSKLVPRQPDCGQDARK
ncbi:hypothetical protein E2I00_009089, partial [Balaenoptera physalus]